MDWKQKLQEAWENRGKIANGFWNAYVVHNPEIYAEAARRKAICESNVCGYYDKDGKPETSQIPGQPACSICHCNIHAKVHCTYCWCALKDIDKEPLWNVMMTKEQDDILKAQEWQEQFTRNQK